MLFRSMGKNEAGKSAIMQAFWKFNNVSGTKYDRLLDLPGEGAAPMTRILCIFGTRPEAIKLCPLVHRLRAQPDKFAVKVCVTAQHRDMLDQVLEAFSVAPDYDLDLMQPGQTLAGLTAHILAAIEPVLEAEHPDLVVVQGDTTTTLAGAVGAFYKQITVAHVEAGLRTGDMMQPFPEEMNRVLTSRIATWHFAPTDRKSVV